MADCFLMKSGSGNSNASEYTLLANYPLTTDLKDTLGVLPDLVSSTSKPSISEKGIYLYRNSLTLSDYQEYLKDFLTIQMEISYSTSGAYHSYRRIVFFDGNWGIELPGTQYVTLNCLDTNKTKIKQSDKTYADSSFKTYYPLQVTFDFKNYISQYIINDNDGGITSSPELSATSIVWGHETYGLNGYIKNLKIYTK